MKFDKNCTESVKHVLSVSKLYSINNFSYRLTENDIGIKANNTKHRRYRYDYSSRTNKSTVFCFL